MHADNHGPNIARRLIPCEHTVKPLQLPGIELILAGIVERDEIDVMRNPVIIGAQLVIGGVVREALCAKRGSVQPVGELNQIRRARLRRDGLVIARDEIDGKFAEGTDLMSDKSCQAPVSYAAILKDGAGKPSLAGG